MELLGVCTSKMVGTQTNWILLYPWVETRSAPAVQQWQIAPDLTAVVLEPLFPTPVYAETVWQWPREDLSHQKNRNSQKEKYWLLTSTSRSLCSFPGVQPSVNGLPCVWKREARFSIIFVQESGQTALKLERGCGQFFSYIDCWGSEAIYLNPRLRHKIFR